MEIQQGSSGGGTPGGVDTSVQYNDDGAFGGDNYFTYDKDTQNLEIHTELGAELAPALTTGNWTLGTGWAFGTNTLEKNANGTGSAVSSFTPTVGVQYEVSITFSSFTATSLNQIKMGNVVLFGNPTVSGELSLNNPIPSAVGTYTCTFYARSTTAMSILPGTTSRFVISNISIKEIAQNTGGFETDGDITTNNGTLRIGQTIITPSVRLFGTSGTYNDLSFNGLKPRFIEFGTSAATLTGLDLDQEDGQEVYLSSLFANIDIAHQSASSSAANRFVTPSSVTMVSEPGSLIYCKYSEVVGRWFVYKIGTSATQFNGYTNGLTFSDWLNTLVANGLNYMLVQSDTGRASLELQGDGTFKSTLGDVGGSGNNTRGVWDDANAQISQYINNSVTGSEFRILDANGSRKLLQFKAGDGNFNTRELDINSRTLISDKPDGDPDPIDNSAILELRVGNDETGSYRGWLMPRVPANQVSTIPTPITGLQIYLNDSGAEGISTYNGTDSVWVTNYTSRFTVATLPATAVMGDRAFVTDENGSGFGNAATGGGALVLPVFYNGTNWIVG